MSAGSAGAEAANDQGWGNPMFVTDDGRHVAWTGKGPDITGNPSYDSIVVSRNMDTNINTIVSRNGNGTPAANANVYGMSPDGSKILYVSASSGTVSNRPASAGGWHAYIWTRADQTNRSVDRRDKATGNIYPYMSTNARFVVFEMPESAGYPANAVGNGSTDIVAWDSQAPVSP